MEDLPGALEIERPRSGRWVTIGAVIVPVIAVVLSVAWFVRAFVAPPIVMVPAPPVLASAPSAAEASDAQNAAVAEARARLADQMTETSGKSVYTPSLPMVASLAAAPPAATPPSVPEPTAPAPPPSSSEAEAAVTPEPLAAAPDTPTGSLATAADPEPTPTAEIETGEPIQGPIPVPPRRPRFAVAHAVIRPVPLPRPRPVEATVKPDPDVPNFERHTVQ